MEWLIFFVFLYFNITSAQTDSSKKNTKDEPIYITFVESMPEPIDGLIAIQKAINYPKEALLNHIEGKVYIIATIDTLGNVLKAKIIQGIGYGCDEEALRVLSRSKFKPAVAGHKRIVWQITIPIVFKLQNQKQ